MAVRCPRIRRSHSLSPSKVAISSTTSIPLISATSHKHPVLFNVQTIPKCHGHATHQATSSQITPELILPGRQYLSQCAEGRPVDNSTPSVLVSALEHGESDFVDAVQIYGDPTPGSTSALHKRQNQYRRWSQEVIPALLKPYMRYLHLSKSLSIPVNCQDMDIPQCEALCLPRNLQVTCLYFDRELMSPGPIAGLTGLQDWRTLIYVSVLAVLHHFNS